MTVSVKSQRGVHPASGELDRVPAVGALLARLGLGEFEENSVDSRPGRNDIWCGTTTTGASVFVKRMTGDPFDIQQRTRRLLSFETALRAFFPFPRGSGAALDAPRLLGHDAEAAVFAFTRVTDGEPGNDLMIERRLDEDTARRCGRAVAHLHSLRPGEAAQLDDSVPLFPSLKLLEGIPDTMFDLLGTAELQMWRLLQTDDELRGAVARLLRREREAPRVPVHCDLRLDQFLIAGEHLTLTDWEELRLGDPARDVGAFIGECLYRSVLDIVSGRGEVDFTAASLTVEDVLRRGVERIRARQPLMAAFTAGYAQGRPGRDPRLAARAAAFAGWHLIDRMIATAHFRPRLLGIERAAAGIGRTALLDPDRFVGSLGLEPLLN
ncbi:class V lanthionine synthetase subunit LxmK [Streptomyces cacaoi]|uniref:class V lanthionine synthetase subunit LxmK n=1 Tax=Streptomyces cacaoi TaxID=1898 RepID=UPI0037497417